MEFKNAIHAGQGHKVTRGFSNSTKCLLCKNMFTTDNIIFLYCQQCIDKLKEEEAQRPIDFFFEEIRIRRFHE